MLTASTVTTTTNVIQQTADVPRTVTIRQVHSTVPVMLDTHSMLTVLTVMITMNVLSALITVMNLQHAEIQSAVSPVLATKDITETAQFVLNIRLECARNLKKL